MRKKYLLIGLIGLMSMAGLYGCSKQKTCRCSVLSNVRGSTVRIIKIESGSCEDIKMYGYHDDLDSLFVDTLLCTDYEFDIDSRIE